MPTEIASAGFRAVRRNLPSHSGKPENDLVQIFFRVSVVSTILFITVPNAISQSPFVTDDAEVAGLRHWHFEFSNEYDILPSAAFPNERQNNANFKASYGVATNLELGFDNQLLDIKTAPNAIFPLEAFGYGDLDLSIKWKFAEEKSGLLSPALAFSLNVEIPTGDARRQLGSGVYDYYLNGCAQKKLWKASTLRVNAGYYFAGNTVTGAVGIRTATGSVFTAGASAVRDFSPKLDLGVEVVGAATSNFDLNRGQLQIQVGGNYKPTKTFSLDFGLIKGFYQGSPRFAPIVGFSHDFN